MNEIAQVNGGESPPTPNNVANLRDAKREQARNRRGKAETPKKAPAKKAPAKKAPAKRATPTVDYANRISWKPKGEKNAKGEAESVGTAGDRTYEITRQEDDLWRCTVKVGDAEPQLIAENLKSGKIAWRKCVDHAKGTTAA
jgi:hypothetical protein